ncbi:T9SS type A sorting domain-containing protein [Hymenobacter sp. RP-2-7]|uniref:T9SS type A sorting domain-containing protein n=1 Tax=Hymenobacter polaris TaxID=2682546 RepID=A0A7Y0AEA6_9BACT|nr:T9SS type A sorting domain-containing protein [Hymenobacter polaris]NML65721.1 T9SS type A sorting domain-containing protein [Hymenobacter polaris]
MRTRFTWWGTLGVLVALGVARPARAQGVGLAFGSVAQVVQGADTLAQAWVGGLNTPQFSALDLDGDGQPDLYAFDRESARSYTWLSVATPSGRRYRYAPDYAAAFPADMTGWALLRDYDCDGRPDLFTAGTSGNIRVFRNAADASGRPSFVLANGELSFPAGNGYTANLNIGAYNLPAIQDVNGDGKLDILTYDFYGSTLLELYLNASPDACGGVSTFNRVSTYWGQLQVSCVSCNSYQLVGDTSPCATYRTDHSQGHNVLLLDLNGDGKLDLLDGRDNCATLTRLLNSGASSTDALLAPAGASSSFPSAAAPVNLPVFPAPYQLDADFDGVPDLLIAPNMLDNSADRVSLRQCVRLYHNAATSASATPSYTLTNSSFLQSEMLDVSEGAMAAFGDLDGDGLPDMLIGNQGDQVNGYYRASLSYYRNVGTARRPVYRLVSDDYLGLGAAAVAANARFESLRPALVDLNRDGTLDLTYSAYDGTTNRLYYLLNAAGRGQAASFTPSQVSYFKDASGTGSLAATPNDTPCFYDVDGDGYVDILLGTNVLPGAGSLRYFRNRGAAGQGNLDNLFVLADADYGQLRTAGSRPPNLAVAVADFDGNGQPDLLTADGTGAIVLYADFRGQSGSFAGSNNLFYNALSGQYTASVLGHTYSALHMAPTAADLNQDGTPELYLGTETGGLVSYLPRPRAVLATQPGAAAALAFSVYPNPAARAATAETAQPTRLVLFDLAGRRVLADATLARTHQLNLAGLAPGLYVAQATAADGTSTTQRLAVAE